MMRISAVFIAYNEEESVNETLQRSVKSLERLCKDFEIIVVNDGSRDRTGELLDAISQKDSRIKILHNEKNLGIGHALWRGLKAAQGEYITHNGMDYCFDLEDLGKMIPLLERSDVVVGYRDQYTGYTQYRRIVSAINLTLLHLLFGLKLRDFNFTQLYKKQVLDSISLDARSGGFLVPEILIRAHDLGFRLSEIQIEYHRREKGVSTAGKWRVLYESFSDMLRFWMKRLLKQV